MDRDMGGTCEFEEELPLLLYRGELETAERARLRDHVAGCARCEGALAELESAASALDAAPVVRPSPEKWASLKANVLEALRTGDAAPASACASFEEDLLVLEELEAPRREDVLAHVQACAPCSQTRAAFASVSSALAAEPIVWPETERWDALKPAVMAAVAKAPAPALSSATASSGNEAPATRTTFEPVRPAIPANARRPGVAFGLRVAAAVLILVSGGFAVERLRGFSPEDIHRLKHEADGTNDLALARRDYGLVEREGAGKPACEADVEDARAQLVALTRYERALAQKDQDLRRVELLNVISQFPDSHATEFALGTYRDTLGPQVAGVASPDRRPIEVPLLVNEGYAMREVDFQMQLVKLEKLPALERDQKTRDLESFYAASLLQSARRRSDPMLAKVDYKRVLQLEHAGPAAYLAQKRLKELAGQGEH